MIDLLLRPEARKLIAAGTGSDLAARLREALRVLGRSRSQVALLLTCDAEIRALNRNYRKLDRATDVLSFHQQELSGSSDPAGDGVFLGDIVISVETARRRTGEHRLPGELARLGIHGLCHLFGYDHHRPGPAEKMRKLEQKLLRASRLSGRGSSSARSSRAASSRRPG